METLGLVILVLFLIVVRQNLIIVLISAVAYVHLVWGEARLIYIVEDLWISLNSEVLLAIPMFIAAGSLMSRGSITQRLVDIMTRLTEWLPGGLGVATILSCAVFAAISGSSAVTLLAIGSILYPALIKEGYPESFALGAITSAGTLGIIIPPSIPLILYGIVTETSISDLFSAGIVPGILLTIALGAYALWVNRRLPSRPFQPRLFIHALRSGIWALLLPVILLGGIYSGFFSPTEAAAVAVGYSLIVELIIHREISLSDIFNTAVETSKILGTLFPIVAIAMSIKTLLTIEQVPQELTTSITGIVSSKYEFLLAINLLLLVVGCFVDVVSAILILSPLLLGVARFYGVDPIHLGIIMVINLEIGYLTPPMGLNLIVAMTAFRSSFFSVCRAVLPFLFVILVILFVVTFVADVPLYFLR